jgi:hypothetical protein
LHRAARAVPRSAFAVPSDNFAAVIAPSLICAVPTLSRGRLVAA